MSVQGGQRRSMFLIASLALGGVVGGHSWSLPGAIPVSSSHRGNGLSTLEWGQVRRNGFTRTRATLSEIPTEPQNPSSKAITILQEEEEDGDFPSAIITNDSGRTLILADDPDFIKPERDMRQYRVIILPNNLKVMLISDQLQQGEVGVEAASVHVQAGHFDDTVKGLAHFHEHMLFLGTKKYPNEDEYENYLSQYGGYSNAYTDMEDTNYFFAVTTEAGSGEEPSDALKGALDRFAQFFIAPTFDRDVVDREIKAIDQEYTMSKTSDSWRNYQLLKSTCNQRHPFAKFGCGNYATLTEQGLDYLLSELERFWKSYYQTWNLRLSVVGHASLDALQEAVENTFGQLPTSNGKPRRLKSLPNQTFARENAVYGAGPAYGPEQLGLTRMIIPYAETRVLKIYFATPPLDDRKIDDTKPYRAISHILGHESPGSLHALLNEEGYLTALSSGFAIDTADFSLFSLTLAVTPKGMRERERVLDLVFQWVALLKQNKDNLPLYHDELCKISDVSFRFRENGDPTDFVAAMSEQLFDDTVEAGKLLVAPTECGTWDPIVAEAFLDRLRPDNCMITVTSSDFDSYDGEWITEPWYGAQYKVEPIPIQRIEEWSKPTNYHDKLHIPALNKFIPSDFSLKCDQSGASTTIDNDVEKKAPPKLLIERPDLRLWHKLDQVWRVPKTYLRLAILSSKIYATPRTMTLNRLFERVLKDDLNSFVYDASMAGCNYRVTCTPSGYRLSVRGYSEKVPFLLETLTARMKSLIAEMKCGDPTAAKRFEKAKESLLRETKNYRLDTPHEVNSYNSRILIEENVWYLDNYIDELEGEQAANDPVTMEECARAAEECLMGRLKCEALCMGNIDEQGSFEVASMIDKQLLGSVRPLSEVETPRFRSLKLPTREEAIAIFGPDVATRPIPLVYQELAYSPTEENNAVELIFQVGCELELGYEGMALLDLLTHIAYGSVFNQLRTKEQLGYLVSSFARKTAGGAWGMSVLVQSGVALPEKLEERCEAWLEIFRKELEDMTPENVAQEASAVAAQLLETETKLSQEVSRVWGEILNTECLTDRLRNPAFERLEKLAEILTVIDDGEEVEADVPRFKAEDLKKKILKLFDDHISISSPKRRAMIARVYNHNSKVEYEAALNKPGVLSTYADMRQLKQFLSSWPMAPYWRIENKSD